MIDPHNGWCDGFPKSLTVGEERSLQDCLTENGNPNAEINVFQIADLCR